MRQGFIILYPVSLIKTAAVLFTSTVRDWQGRPSELREKLGVFSPEENGVEKCAAEVGSESCSGGME